VGENVVRVLRKTGMEVVYPEGQICCGQLFFNSGHWRKSLPLARNTIRAFSNAEIVVGPSGSCVKMIRHHYMDLFREDPAWLARAQELSDKIYEFSEFLIHVLQVDDLGAAFRARVTYHDSCQVRSGLGISSEPRQLLRMVKGLELVEMEKSERCCGFGGLFSVKSPHIADAIVAEKARYVSDSRAEVVTGCEISCLMHMERYFQRHRMSVRALHLADILARDK
jgi:L-lactate dehydrogenase complex protein LldE